MINMLKRWGAGRLALVTLGLAAAALILMMRHAHAPAADERVALEPTLPPAAEALEGNGRVEPSCEIMQTMGFSRCGHSVTRRVRVPEQLTGADFQAVQAYYDLWQIEAYAPASIVMSREIPLYCPMHQVLGVSEAGEIVLSRNVYGDGMAVTAAYGIVLEVVAEDKREALLVGLGFDSQAEAEAWLAAGQ